MVGNGAPPPFGPEETQGGRLKRFALKTCFWIILFACTIGIARCALQI